MRKPHNMRKSQNCEMPQDAIWVDTETNPEILADGSERHVLDFGYAAHRRRRSNGKWTKPDWLRFETIDEFWEWAESKLHGKCKLYMFAHNWAFDAPVLDTFNQLPERGYTLIGAVIQSPPVILRWRKKPQTIMMVDTLNIWRMSLKKLGKSIGLKKLTMPKRGASVEDWNTYGKRDTEIIMRACLEWWEFLVDNDLGGFATTIASQAMRTFRHRFMHHKILIDDNEEALALARASLHGGRTECFYIGKIKTKLYKLDINSQYPAVMQKEYMPTKLLGHYRHISKKDMTAWLKHYCLTARCIVKTEQPVFPTVKDDRLIFPVGEFIAELSTPEIAYGLKHKLIRKIIECNLYERAVLFTDYMDWFYTHRRKCIANNDEVGSALAKLFMTNLYGKFAQKGIIYTKVADTESTDIRVWIEYDMDDDETHHMRQYAKIIEEQTKETESRDSHPAIAAHITAHARMQLWGLMQGCGQGRYYYCDTDSLWVDSVAHDALSKFIDNERLGYLKLEGIHDGVVVLGAKDYIVDGVATIKGIRSTAKKVANNVYEQDKFTSLIGLLRLGDLTAPIVTQITKHLRREYSKGTVNKDGSISPLILTLER